MTLREISAIVSTVLVTFGTISYILQALKGSKVKPVLAAWIVLGGTNVLSFATYWTSPRHNLVANACNAISVLSTLSILGTIVWIYRKREEKIRFNNFQKLFLTIAGAIAIIWVHIVWGFGGTGIVPNILTQLLMVIGYVVTLQRLWNAEKNSESFQLWGSIALAGFVSLYTGIASDDPLAILYAGRAAVTSSIMVGRMFWLELKHARAKKLT